jgi:hypothetical protein
MRTATARVTARAVARATAPSVATTASALVMAFRHARASIVANVPAITAVVATPPAVSAPLLRVLVQWLRKLNANGLALDPKGPIRGPVQLGDRTIGLGAAPHLHKTEAPGLGCPPIGVLHHHLRVPSNHLAVPLELAHQGLVVDLPRQSTNK